MEYILLQRAGSGFPVLQSQRLMYEAFEGARFTLSLCPCSF